MNKLAMILAAVLVLAVNSAFANFVPGRVDTVVYCSTTLVNGYSFEVTNVEGTPGYFATISHGGVIGSTRLAGPIEVKMSSKGYVTTLVDVATGGQKLKLEVNQKLDPATQSSNPPSFSPNSRLSLHSPLPEEPSIPMYCKFPVHIM